MTEIDENSGQITFLFSLNNHMTIGLDNFITWRICFASCYFVGCEICFLSNILLYKKFSSNRTIFSLTLKKRKTPTIIKMNTLYEKFTIFCFQAI